MDQIQAEVCTQNPRDNIFFAFPNNECFLKKIINYDVHMSDCSLPLRNIASPMWKMRILSHEMLTGEIANFSLL